METHTKESLVRALLQIKRRGWIPNARQGNAGGVGNTLEDLLGIRENNLPIPNAAEWELKCQRLSSRALLTLFHCEPSPQGLRFVVTMMLPQYGWAHKEAGTAYSAQEMSFRQTISGLHRSDRGFKVVVDRTARKVLVSFDARAADPKHGPWLEQVRGRVGMGELCPQPYWGFSDLAHKAGDKLHNCFYVQAQVRKIGGVEHFQYSKITILQGFSYEAFLRLLEGGNLFADFDARSGHNHGTKFRVRQDRFPELYQTVIDIESEDVDLSKLS